MYQCPLLVSPSISFFPILLTFLLLRLSRFLDVTFILHRFCPSCSILSCWSCFRLRIDGYNCARASWSSSRLQERADVEYRFLCSEPQTPSSNPMSQFVASVPDYYSYSWTQGTPPNFLGKQGLGWSRSHRAWLPLPSPWAWRAELLTRIFILFDIPRG